MSVEAEVTKVRIINSRKAGREAAFAALYSIVICKSSAPIALKDSFDRNQFSPVVKEFIENLVWGVMNNRQQLDFMITKYLNAKWSLDRIAITDLCALRLAVYELLHLDNMPPKVTINEAVELSKKYGTVENGKFVNGLLGKLMRETSKANWDPGKAEKMPEDENIELEEVEVTEGEVIKEDSEEFGEVAPKLRWSIKSTN